MSSSSSSRSRPRSAGSAGLLLVLAATAPWRCGLAQQQDEALVGQLARLLAAADARAFDAALFRETLHHPDAVVRRQAALAVGRIGDPAGTDLLVEALADSGAAVRAAAGAGARRPGGAAGPAASGSRHGDRQDRRRRGRGCAARYPGQWFHAGHADVARPEHGAARGL